MVVGTTGFNPEQLMEFKRTVADITCVFASNFSTAMNVLFKLVEEAARILGDDYDVEIVEAHHRHKVDAPSRVGADAGRAGRGRIGPQLARGSCPRGGSGVVGERSRQEIGNARDPRRRLGRASTRYSTRPQASALSYSTAPRAAIPLPWVRCAPLALQRKLRRGCIRWETCWGWADRSALGAEEVLRRRPQGLDLVAQARGFLKVFRLHGHL